MTHHLAAQFCADLANAVQRERGFTLKWSADGFGDGTPCTDNIAFRRYVEAVSEAVKQFRKDWDGSPVVVAECDRLLGQFVLPEPVDPVVEALNDAMPGAMGSAIRADIARDLRAALGKRGLHITEIGESTDATEITTLRQQLAEAREALADGLVGKAIVILDGRAARMQTGGNHG